MRFTTHIAFISKTKNKAAFRKRLLHNANCNLSRYFSDALILLPVQLCYLSYLYAIKYSGLCADDSLCLNFDRIVQVERGSPNSMCLVESGRVSLFFLLGVASVLKEFLSKTNNCNV